MLHADIVPTNKTKRQRTAQAASVFQSTLYPLQRMYCGQTYCPYAVPLAMHQQSLAPHTCQPYHTLRCGRSWYGATSLPIPAYWLAASSKAGCLCPIIRALMYSKSP